MKLKCLSNKASKINAGCSKICLPYMDFLNIVTAYNIYVMNNALTVHLVNYKVFKDFTFEFFLFFSLLSAFCVGSNYGFNLQKLEI